MKTRRDETFSLVRDVAGVFDGPDGRPLGGEPAALGAGRCLDRTADGFWPLSGDRRAVNQDHHEHARLAANRYRWHARGAQLDYEIGRSADAGRSFWLGLWRAAEFLGVA